MIETSDLTISKISADPRLELDHLGAKTELNTFTVGGATRIVSGACTT